MNAASRSAPSEPCKIILDVIRAIVYSVTMKTNQFCKPLKGLTAYVLTPAGGVGSQSVIACQHKCVTIVGDGIPEVFEADAESPAVKFVRRELYGEVVLHLEPVAPASTGYHGWMFGGAAIHCCDSRFSEAIQRLGYPSHCAIKLHDRQEPDKRD